MVLKLCGLRLHLKYLNCRSAKNAIEHNVSHDLIDEKAPQMSDNMFIKWFELDFMPNFPIRYKDFHRP